MGEMPDFMSPLKPQAPIEKRSRPNRAVHASSFKDVCYDIDCRPITIIIRRLPTTDSSIIRQQGAAFKKSKKQQQKEVTTNQNE